MSYRKALIRIVFVIATVVAGCAGPSKRTGPDPQSLVKAYVERGREYEEKGDLVEARKQYELALTVNPSDQTAIKNRDRVGGTMDRLAHEHYDTGLKLQKEGKYGEARREFLTALRLRPDYPEAVEMLTARKSVRAKRYIVHTIQPGESISKLAAIYYGDPKKFPVIAQYNDISDATQVKVGQKIKVPEISGVTLQAKKQDVQTEESATAEAAVSDQEPKMEIEREEGLEEEEPIDAVAMYRDQGIDLFNNKKYQEAITELNKAESANPQDAVTRDYLFQSHFQEATVLFQRKDYLAAKKEFEASLRYKRDCTKCDEYAKKSEEIYKDIHYKKGIAYFGKEQLKEALEEWELVRALDPGYMTVEENIEKATKLLNRLEEIKKAQQKGQAK